MQLTLILNSKTGNLTDEHLWLTGKKILSKFKFPKWVILNNLCQWFAPRIEQRCLVVTMVNSTKISLLRGHIHYTIQLGYITNHKETFCDRTNHKEWFSWLSADNQITSSRVIVYWLKRNGNQLQVQLFPETDYHCQGKWSMDMRACVNRKQHLY